MNPDFDAGNDAPAEGTDAPPIEPQQQQTPAEQSSPPVEPAEAAPPRIEVPPEILAERSADRARQMYDPKKTYWSALPDSDTAPEGVDLATARALRAEAAEMLADATMSATEAERFMATVRKWSGSPPSDETRQSWRVEAAQRLHELYGKDAQRELNRATAWLKRDPRRLKLMDHNGLGDHPNVILLAVEIARRTGQKVTQ